MPAVAAFEQGMGGQGVRVAEDGSGVVLYDRVLIEDDGPGISSDARWLEADRSPVTVVTGKRRVKKILRIDRQGAQDARLYYGEEGISVLVNGTKVEVPADTLYPRIPPELLKAGDNEIVLFSEAGRSVPVRIASLERIFMNDPSRRDRPRRSFVSEDGGATWKQVDGEYMVRLHLIQYVRSGSFVSPVIDLAREESAVITPAAVLSRVTATPEGNVPAGASVEIAIRTGSTPVPDERRWSEWKEPGSLIPVGHRYLQWKATLRSNSPSLTPVLKQVRVEGVVDRQTPPRWASRLSIVSSRNETIRYTSIPFLYEDPGHPKMKALREKYRLDEVVAGSKTEFEAMVKLRNWVAHQWRFAAPRKHIAWDADEILTAKTGFCVQYAIVFMECATALGRQTRFVFGYHPGAHDGGGHEVCEWWSNEYGKWVFFDINQNWCYLDRKTGVPLGLLELHDLMLKRCYDGGYADWRKAPKQPVYTDDVAICYETSVLPGQPPPRLSWQMKDGLYRVPTRWLHIRMMPRNNFLSQPLPVPILHGTHWDWPDYIIWEDASTPKQYRYRNYTSRRNDFDWSINQVEFVAGHGEEPGVLAVKMGTVTPYFDTFLVNVDGAGWKESGDRYEWKLHPGRNRLEMRVRNSSGVLGIPGHLEVDFSG